MEDEIRVFETKDGIVVFGGDDEFIDDFLTSLDLETKGKPLDLSSLRPHLHIASVVVSGLAEIWANSGRFLKITKESQEAIKKIGLIDTAVPGVKYSTLGKPGKVKEWVKVETGLEAVLSNPAVLSGVGGMMMQLAIHQSLAEITQYLKKIDKKLDTALRKIDDIQVADLLGSWDTVEEAKIERKHTGVLPPEIVRELGTFQTTAKRAKYYAWGQIGEVRRSLDESKSLKELVSALTAAQPELAKWLTLLALAHQLEIQIDGFKLEGAAQQSHEAYENQLDSVQENQARRRSQMEKPLNALLLAVFKAAATAESKQVLNQTEAKRVNQQAAALADLVNQFADVVQLTVHRKAIRSEELTGLKKVVSDTIQYGREEWPTEVLKQLIVHGPKLLSAVKKVNWGKLSR